MGSVALSFCHEERTQPKTGTRRPLSDLWCRSGEKCELSTGQPRTEPHRDRGLLAKSEAKLAPSEEFGIPPTRLTMLRTHDKGRRCEAAFASLLSCVLPSRVFERLRLLHPITPNVPARLFFGPAVKKSWLVRPLLLAPPPNSIPQSWSITISLPFESLTVPTNWPVSRLKALMRRGSCCSKPESVAQLPEILGRHGETPGLVQRLAPASWRTNLPSSWKMSM